MDYGIFNVRTYLNVCDCTGGSTDTVSVCTESWLREKNPSPHHGIEPVSTACRSDALPTELHPHPNKASPKRSMFRSSAAYSHLHSLSLLLRDIPFLHRPPPRPLPLSSRPLPSRPLRPDLATYFEIDGGRKIDMPGPLGTRNWILTHMCSAVSFCFCF